LERKFANLKEKSKYVKFIRRYNLIIYNTLQRKRELWSNRKIYAKSSIKWLNIIGKFQKWWNKTIETSFLRNFLSLSVIKFK
jgi:hypothetical protein